MFSWNAFCFWFLLFRHLGTNSLLAKVVERVRWSRTKSLLKKQHRNWHLSKLLLKYNQGSTNCFFLPSRMVEHGGSLENTENMKKWKTSAISPKTHYLWLKTAFTATVEKLRAWRTWSWVSSRCENITRNIEPWWWLRRWWRSPWSWRGCLWGTWWQKGEDQAHHGHGDRGLDGESNRSRHCSVDVLDNQSSGQKKRWGVWNNLMWYVIWLSTAT